MAHGQETDGHAGGVGSIERRRSIARMTRNKRPLIVVGIASCRSSHHRTVSVERRG